MKVRIQHDSLMDQRVFLDEDEISGSVHEVEVNIRAGCMPEIRLTLNVMEVEVTSMGERDSTMLVSIPDDTKAILRKLGWTENGDGRTTYTVPREDLDL